MTTVTYSVYSPYFETKTYGNFLDVMINRPITPKTDDVVYIIDSVYEYRPDLLAADTYGNSALWWVFAQRNPDVLKDPLFDFKAGTEILIPKIDTLRKDLGI